MKRYAIRYTRIPTHYNDTLVAVVEAESPELATKLLQHQLGDHSGVRNAPDSKGRVITLSQM